MNNNKIVPINDLPDNLVPRSDLPDNIVPKEDMPDYSSSPYSGQMNQPQVVNSVLQDAKPANSTQYGYISNNPTPEENMFFDSAKGFLSGLTTIPRAGGQFGNKYLRPMIGKKPLNQEDLNKTLANLGANNYNPQSIVGNVSKFAGNLVPYLLMPEVRALQGFKGANLANEALTGLYQGGIVGGTESASRGDFDNLGREAMIDSLLGATSPIGVAGAKFGIGKGAPVVHQVLSAVPRESSERFVNKLLQGNDIFAGKFNPSESLKLAGRQAQNAINELTKREGQAYQNELNTVRNMRNVKIPTNNLAQTLDNLIGQQNYGGINTLNNNDLDVLNMLRNNFNQGKLTPEQLIGLKKAIQNAKTHDNNAVKLTTDQGDYILGQAENSIDNILKNLFPEHKQASLNYSNIKNLKKGLGVRLKDANVTRLVQNYGTKASNESFTDDLLEQLNNMASPNNKFLDLVQDVNARSDYEKWFPFTPSNGIRNRMDQQKSIEGLKILQSLALLGGAGAGGVATNPWATLPLTLLQSPKVQAGLTRGTVKTLDSIPNTLLPLLYSQYSNRNNK